MVGTERPGQPPNPSQRSPARPPPPNYIPFRPSSLRIVEGVPLDVTEGIDVWDAAHGGKPVGG